ncbi:MAG TPA: asparagine synthase (glutamine-hydrolyzing) [Methylotenera sp.]
MCGIAGFISISRSSEELAFEATQRMVSSMHNRGPDAKTVWTDDCVVLGHRRLAIIDLDSRANQPILSDDERYVIVFNGEIYNFKELRIDLESEGMLFRTSSDTEVLLALYVRERERMLPKLRGMFAFAIWDKHNNELFLGRDSYGIKPLYYAQTKEGLIFASQVKALLVSGVVSKKIEPAGVAGFYLWGSVPEPWTLYQDILVLPAGHYMRVNAGVAQPPVFWSDIRKNWREKVEQLPIQELQEHVRQAVTDSVRAHMVADVPLCVFLSGGIDSGALAGLVSELGAKVEGITIGFDEFTGQAEDEVPVAASIAAHYGLPHFVRRISNAEFEQDIPKILDAMDQPSIDGVNTWFASKAAAERGYKVVLSGVGGDELFAGYSSFQQIPRMAALGKVISAIPGTRPLLKKVCGYLAKVLDKPKLASIPDFMNTLEGAYFLKRSLFLPEELPALMGVDMACEGLKRLRGCPPGMVKANARDGAATVGLLESTHYLRNQLLRDSDWASMAHSLELRTPLVDTQLLETLGPFVSNFTGGIGKGMLARSPVNSLPELIINRPKTGFSLPMAQWLSLASDKTAWSDLPILSASSTPWARRWARVVVERMTKCE